MRIAPEEPKDQETIYRLTKAAFDPMSFSDGTEADCLNRLRQDGDLVLSLVAFDGEALVGHIAFSPVFFDGVHRGWFGLGPVSVWPERQNQGIGSALIGTGLNALRHRGARGCALIGDPAYYSRFGFVGDGRLTYRDLPGSHVKWLTFGADRPSGALLFSSGLE